MEEKRTEEEIVEPEGTKEEVVEPEELEEEEPEETAEDAHLNKIYSNVASNRYENLRTSYIENKAKELRKRTK